MWRHSVVATSTKRLLLFMLLSRMCLSRIPRDEKTTTHLRSVSTHNLCQSQLFPWLLGLPWRPDVLFKYHFSHSLGHALGLFLFRLCEFNSSHYSSVLSQTNKSSLRCLQNATLLTDNNETLAEKLLHSQGKCQNRAKTRKQKCPIFSIKYPQFSPINS